ncbi:MAG: FeoB-associated Cys-rich membrane protein [Eubacteriales bacterium]|nr:FeoB-associated Cys-rich membrane protein [Lachnospiraceae bacterium]MDO5127847.1 FeoB-associated Cys-rich membrane protein [Eubacteriales bacterium]
MGNVIVLIVLMILVAVVVCYLYRKRKMGSKCIGCPYSSQCGGKCGNQKKK